MPPAIYDSSGRRRAHHPGTILLKRSLARHGGTMDDFAKEVLGRSRVSVWRWMRRTHPIPAAVIARLKAYLTETAHA